MTVNDFSFRDMFHKVCYIETPAKINKTIIEAGFGDNSQATGILAYGYIDHEAGFSFEVLCWATSDGAGILSTNGGNERVSLKLRRGSVSDCSTIVLDTISLTEYQDKIDMVNSGYAVPESVSETRNLTIIDSCRNIDYPDDVMVIIWKKDLQGEGCWVRCEGLVENQILGILLNEPTQNFGIHRGDNIGFNVAKKNDNLICIARL